MTPSGVPKPRVAIFAPGAAAVADEGDEWLSPMG